MRTSHLINKAARLSTRCPNCNHCCATYWGWNTQQSIGEGSSSLGRHVYISCTECLLYLTLSGTASSCNEAAPLPASSCYLSVRPRLTPSSSLRVEESCPGSSLSGASGERSASARHLEQQISAAQRRARMGCVKNTNMMQLAAPCEVLPIPCKMQYRITWEQYGRLKLELNAHNINWWKKKY